jgi:hypothetical protein
MSRLGAIDPYVGPTTTMRKSLFPDLVANCLDRALRPAADQLHGRSIDLVLFQDVQDGLSALSKLP